MLKKSIAIAVFALAAATPAIAAPALPALPSFGGMSGAGKAFALPSASAPKFPKFAGAGAAGSMLPSLPSAGGGSAFLTTLETGPATLLSVTPLSPSTQVLPASTLGLRTQKISKPSFKGRASNAKLNLGAGKIAISQFSSNLTALPKTGLGILTSSAGSADRLPIEGAAQLRGFGL